MRHEFPDRPISVMEIQGYLVHNPLDCSKNSREIMEVIEEHFGWRIRIASLVLACLWSGYGVLPYDQGQVFRFCKFEK
jgi:hypothetical protein